MPPTLNRPRIIILQRGRRRIPPSDFLLSLYIQLIPHPDTLVAAFLLYRGNQLIAHRWIATPDRTGALLTALADGLESMHNLVFDRPLRAIPP